MSKTDQDRRDSDSIKLATAYLDATRALESMPPAVSDAIWARLERSVLVDAGSSRPTDDATDDDAPIRLITSSKRHWWVATSIAVSVAAALLLTLTLSPGERAGAQGGSQVSAAVYRAKISVEQSALLKGPRSARQGGGESTAAAATPATEGMPSAPEAPSPTTSSAPLQKGAAKASAEEPPKSHTRRRSAVSEGEEDPKEEDPSASELAAADAPEPVVQRPTIREPAAPEGSSLAAETRSLAEARNALDRGEPAQALKLLDRHAIAYPKGFFGEEAAALRIIALCRSNDLAAGRSAASEFFQTYPSSALRARIRNACPSTR